MKTEKFWIKIEGVVSACHGHHRIILRVPVTCVIENNEIIGAEVDMENVEDESRSGGFQSCEDFELEDIELIWDSQ